MGLTKSSVVNWIAPKCLILNFLLMVFSLIPTGILSMMTWPGLFSGLFGHGHLTHPLLFQFVLAFALPVAWLLTAVNTFLWWSKDSTARDIIAFLMSLGIWGGAFLALFGARFLAPSA